jgi:hypothetical protein
MTDTRERQGKRRRDVPQHSSETADQPRSDQQADERRSGGKNPIGRDDNLIGAERLPRKGSRRTQKNTDRDRQMRLPPRVPHP